MKIKFTWINIIYSFFNKKKFLVVTTYFLLLMNFPEICLAQENSREGGKNQTPAQIAIEIVLTYLILKWIEPKVIP